MALADRMSIGDLAEQHPGGRHELFKGEGPAHQQTGKAELTEHHPVE